MDRYQLQTAILAEAEKTKEIRAKERNFVNKSGSPLSVFPSLKPNPLRDHLAGLLPDDIMPSNVGALDEVMWPFFYKVDIDFGSGEFIYDNNTKGEGTFRVGNEGNFLLCGIFRDNADYDTAGYQAPLLMTIRDDQSSRQLNTEAIPVQTIGTKGRPLKFKTPYLMYENAQITVLMKSWLPTGSAVEVDGSGKQTFVFFGYRIRSKEDAVIKQALRSL